MTVLYAHLFKIWFGLFRPNLIGEEKLFIDVELKENGLYTIVVANRDDNTDILLKRLNAIGFTVTNESLRKDKRYEAFTDISADVVIEKINELNEKIQ